MQDVPVMSRPDEARAPLGPEPIVRHFRQIVLWPLQLLHDGSGKQGEGHDALLCRLAPGTWRLVSVARDLSPVCSS